MLPSFSAPRRAFCPLFITTQTSWGSCNLMETQQTTSSQQQSSSTP